MTIEIVSTSDFLRVEQMLKEILERLPKDGGITKKEFLTAKEVRKILQCSDNTLINYRKKEMLPGKKIGGKYYYSETDLNKLLNQKSGGIYGN